MGRGGSKSFALVSLFSWAGEAAIHGIHLAPRESLEEMRVTFSTDTFDIANGSATVKYGNSPNNMTQVSFASTLHFNNTVNAKGIQWIHTADMLNLERGIAYSYQCFSNDGTSGDIFEFTPIHPDNYYTNDNDDDDDKSPFNILFFGDLGHNGGDEVQKKLTALPAMEVFVILCSSH
jgi:hypothetical protein